MPLVQIEACLNSSTVRIIQNVEFTSFPNVTTVFEQKDCIDDTGANNDERAYYVVKQAKGAKVLCGVNSPYEVMTLTQMDNDQIVRLMAGWKQKDVADKIKAIQTFGCYELYIYVKLHDHEFFEKYLREYIQEQHIGQNIYKAYLLDDTKYLLEKSKQFFQMSVFEEFWFT